MKTNSLKSILFFSLLLFAWGAQAQDLFRVMATKGGVQVAKTVAKDWKNVLTGQKLYEDESLTIPAGGYLALVHKSGKTIELKQAGSFNVGDIASKVSANNVSFSQKYSEYVMNELTKGDKADINANHRANSKVTGSVERGEYKGVFVYLPLKSDVINDKHTVRWMAKKTSGYNIKFTNMFEETLFATETTDTLYTFDLSKMDLNGEKSVVIIVTSKEEPKITHETVRYLLNILDGNKASDLRSQEGQLKAELGPEQSSLSSLILGSFYEKNNLMIDAENSYKTAVALEPEVSEYAKACVEFQDKTVYGLSKKK